MDIEQLRAAVEAAGPRVPGRRFSPELREALIRATHRLWGSGEALADIADGLGIHLQTATRYLDVPVELECDEDEVAELLAPGLVPLDLPLSGLGERALRLGSARASTRPAERRDVHLVDMASTRFAGAREGPGDIVLAGCWAHAFRNAAPNHPDAIQIMNWISELYDLDAKAEGHREALARIRREESAERPFCS